MSVGGPAKKTHTTGIQPLYGCFEGPSTLCRTVDEQVQSHFFLRNICIQRVNLQDNWLKITSTINTTNSIYGYCLFEDHNM